ncbi:MAG: response regulator [Candidatus Omnitrophica bacterium]|nr:response regulator [Candidatus Omnitrophota bacterium]
MVKKILIIDDSSMALEMLAETFRSEGYEVITADDGENGLVVADKTAPDVVIIDTLMPGINGFEVCRRLKKNVSSAPKVIIITGSIDAVDALKAQSVGADDYCAKTSDFFPLIEAVKKLI